MIKIDHVAGSIQNTVDCEYYTRHLLRVEYPRNHQLKRAIYPIRHSKELWRAKVAIGNLKSEKENKMGRKSPFPRNQEWSSANAKTLRSWFLLVGRGERGRSSVNKFAGKRSDHALHRKARSPIGTNQAFVYLSRKVSWVELISSCHVVHHCSFDISNWFNEGEVSSFTVCGPFDGCHSTT